MAPSPSSRKAREIFEDAIECGPPDARAAFIAGACGGDTVLLRRVEALLKASDDAESLLPDEPQPPAFSSAAGEQPGDHIGRYKLLEKIGEGGCGVVYMAEQEEPVRRRVALKLIKPGMDTRSVIARFEAERQALAMMDHPNIAKIFDGGVVGAEGGEFEISNLKSEIAGGRPYFVMELVRGIRITDYCRNNALTTRDRLDLFTAVCSAVQHAHQKGIIHRDLKPSNILVTELDGRPVPKVIDFGIARATEQKLTDKTLFTQFAQFVGTPAYMSPEQAAMSGADIDTRSDIYSLGVLLYELLTGTTPFDAKDLLSAGFDEMRRIIRETEPQKPSTRLTQSLRSVIAAGTVISQPQAESREPGDGVRKSEIRNPKSEIESDLDWIVMKCLEKDRARRYETASGMAMDIQRHLNNEPVTARPASAAYRFRKMVRRNKFTFTAGGAVLAALVAGVVVSTWQAVRATRAEHKAQANAEATKTEAEKSRQVAKFLKDILKGVGPSVAQGDDTRMLRKILDKTAERAGGEMKGQPEVEAELRFIIGKVYSALGEYEKAGAMLSEALAITIRLRGDEHREVAALLNEQATVLGHQGGLAQAEAMVREALAIERKLMGKDADVSTSLSNLATILADRGKLAEAATVHREALTMIRKFMGNEHKDVATSLNNLAVVLGQLGKVDGAETLLREALAMQKKLLGNDDPEVATSLNNLANVVQTQNKLAEAESLYREALALQRKLLGNAHPNVAAPLNGLALALLEQGKAVEAEPLLREGVEIERKARKSAHPQTARLIGNLGRVLEAQNQFAEAESMYREAVSICRNLPDTEHPDELSWRNRLQILLKNQGKLSEMETFDRETVAIQRKRFGDEHPGAAAALTNLGDALVDQKKIPESEPPFREALAIRRKLPGDESNLAKALFNLAMTLHWQGKFGEAEPLIQEAADLTVNLLIDDKVENKSKRDALSRVRRLYQVFGKPDEAAHWQQKLTDFDKAEAENVTGTDALSPKR